MVSQRSRFGKRRIALAGIRDDIPDFRG